MEPLPSGANFRRSKILWELGLHIAGNPATRYGGNRDMCITVGTGSGESFAPWLRLATGSAILAHDVTKGGIEAAFVNPSAMLTQAYRGVGLFDAPLPVRILGSYPSWDRFVVAIRKNSGFKSLHDVKKARYPLQMSLREDPTHSTLVLVEQLFAFYGMTIKDIESWGGRVHPCGPPGDRKRLNGLRDGTIDAVFDEGIRTWFGEALACGLAPIELEPDAFAHMEKLGWRRVLIPAGHFQGLNSDHPCIDFSGWPLYASAALPDQVAYDICNAFAARHDEMPWEEGTHQGILQVFTETDATPMDVPLHPGAERWLRENGRS
ncbi:MAG TPA: TAXI family TRAP transporter solute-binding subunit [Stellaceae bacterium]|nr:TAXI family TRAP transporter solute-binding subunit [Stellaceae bacterium]